MIDDRARAGAARGWVGAVLLVLLSVMAYAVYLAGSQKIISRLCAMRYTALAMMAATGGTLQRFHLREHRRRAPDLGLSCFSHPN